jgi:acyl-CoA synthetase (AMP-forming)/AMP-acid ligase II
MKTGDVGQFDGDGDLFLTDRLKEVRACDRRPWRVEDQKRALADGRHFVFSVDQIQRCVSPAWLHTSDPLTNEFDGCTQAFR